MGGEAFGVESDGLCVVLALKSFVAFCDEIHRVLVDVVTMTALSVLIWCRVAEYNACQTMKVNFYTAYRACDIVGRWPGSMLYISFDLTWFIRERLAR